MSEGLDGHEAAWKCSCGSLVGLWPNSSWRSWIPLFLPVFTFPHCHCIPLPWQPGFCVQHSGLWSEQSSLVPSSWTHSCRFTQILQHLENHFPDCALLTVYNIGTGHGLNVTSGKVVWILLEKVQPVSLPTLWLACAVCSLSYPLQEGFEISLADVTFSDADALKMD